MVEYRLVDYRTPRLGGEEDRGDVEDLEHEFESMAGEGWRVAHLLGTLADERILIVYER